MRLLVSLALLTLSTFATGQAVVSTPMTASSYAPAPAIISIPLVGTPPVNIRTAVYLQTSTAWHANADSATTTGTATASGSTALVSYPSLSGQARRRFSR